MRLYLRLLLNFSFKSRIVRLFDALWALCSLVETVPDAFVEVASEIVPEAFIESDTEVVLEAVTAVVSETVVRAMSETTLEAVIEFFVQITHHSSF